MHCWLSTSYYRCPWLCGAALTVATFVAPGVVLATGIAVTSVSSRVVNEIHVVDATVSYALSDDMKAALENGIPLIFDVEIEVSEQRKYLWDPEVVRTVQRLRLQYHALSRTYVVTNDTTHTRQSLPALSEALTYMGDLRGLAISETRHLNAGVQFRGRIRVILDVEALPPPLRPVAYLSPNWHLRSKWQDWILQP